MINTKNQSKPRIIAVYEILHIPTQKVYIGVTRNYRKRESKHKSMLHCKNHDSSELQKDYNQNPLIQIKIIEEHTNRELALNHEQRLLDLYNNDPQLKVMLYNKALDSRLSFKNLVRSEETKIKMSERQLGKKFTDEHKHNLRKPKSEEAKKNMGKARSGIPLSEEHKNKLSKIRKGIPLSEEHKRKIIESNYKPIMVDNVLYKNSVEASKILNIKAGTLRARVKNQNYPNCYYTDKNQSDLRRNQCV